MGAIGQQNELKAKPFFSSIAVLVFGFQFPFAQTQIKTYIVLANGQGAGSTSFAAALGSSIVAQYDQAGIVAQSSDPGFATKAASLRRLPHLPPIPFTDLKQ